MGSECRIYRMEIKYSGETDRFTKTFTQIKDTITDSKVMDVIMDVCRREWYLEGDCGFVGEVNGSNLITALLEHTDYNLDYLEEDEIYEINISW